MTVAPPMNLDEAARPWGRYVQTQLEQAKREVSRTAQDGLNASKAIAASAGLASETVRKVEGVTADLEAATLLIEETGTELSELRETAEAGLATAAERLDSAETLLDETFGLAKSAVTKTVDQYAISDSETVPPAGGWSTTSPTRPQGKFIWRRTAVSRADGTTENGIPAVVTGNAGESAAVLRIDSSRGTVFKNSAVATVLTVTVFHGSERITDMVDLRARFGASAYLEWQWRRLDDSDFGTISSSDSRLSQAGFAFAVSAADVETKTVFMCVLHT